LFKEGLVELIKHGLIKDKSIIEDLGLYKNIDELRKDDFNLLRLIEKSLKVKQYYVESDYHDLGLRNTLNFGHAFGHALELDNNLYHGECVAIGILVNTIKTSFYNEIEELFKKLELIKEFPTLNIEKMKQDKKQANNIIDEVFLNSIGEAIIKKTDINKLISLYQENYQLLQTNYQLAPSLFQITNNNLSGTITIPPSKSQLHRYLIASALSYTKTTLYNITSLNDDIKVTINALKYLDTSITYNKEDSTLIIEPSLYNDLPQTLNMKESGSSLRLLLPLLISKEIEITGENKLPTRPLDTYLDIFNKQNIKIDKQEDNLPLKLSGTLKPDNFIIEENKSSQFISGLLFALPLLKNDSTITCRNIPSSLPYIKMTLNTLHDFGINIEVNNDYTYYKISGNQKYTSKESYNIEQDYSSRCFFEVLNKFDNQEITITNKMEQSIQGDYKVVQLVQEGCNELDLNDMPDAGAIMAIYFSINGGILTNIQRLIHKESNRLEAIKMMLDNFNIKYLQKENTLEIYPSKLVGNKQETFHDHRITMSIIIGATIAKNATYIDEIKSINKSYPSFIDDYILLGGLIDEK
ncbi:MAG: hypothetical protein RR425_05690, partial [Erysipelotrichales bacterium]